MALSWPVKDPNEILDYEIDWSARLGSDTISSSTFTISGSGLTEASRSNTTTATKIWLTGGTDGNDHEVTNRIVTTGGRTMDQTVKLRIRSK